MLDETIIIPSGDYTIGYSRFPLSCPVHSLYIEAFRLMKSAVTNQQFAEFVSAGGYHEDNYWSEIGIRWRDGKQVMIPSFWGNPQFDMPSQPIVGISWYEALAYSRWLSSETQVQWRLPSEVEWEVATQADGTGQIHHAGSRLKRPILAIGEGYQANHGAWNLLGNVWEWCSTRWGRNWQTLDYPYPYVADDGRETLSGSHARVMRGGSWFDPLQDAHASKRARYLPGSRASNIGFRLISSHV